MSLDYDMGLLAKVGLFQGFTPDQLRLLAFGAEREQLPTGETLFHEGDPANGGYVVAVGQVDLTVRRGRREIVVETLEQGGLTGEMALLAPNKRTTDAVAKTDSEVLFIARPLFLRMLREYPETAAALHNHIAQSVRELAFQLQDVHGRLGSISSLADIKGLRDADEPVPSFVEDVAEDSAGDGEEPVESDVSDETVESSN